MSEIETTYKTKSVSIKQCLRILTASITFYLTENNDDLMRDLKYIKIVTNFLTATLHWC